MNKERERARERVLLCWPPSLSMAWTKQRWSSGVHLKRGTFDLIYCLTAPFLPQLILYLLDLKSKWVLRFPLLNNLRSPRKKLHLFHLLFLSPNIKKIKIKKRRLCFGLASQTGAIFFQTRWDCLGSKAEIYIALTGLEKQEWQKERGREKGGSWEKRKRRSWGWERVCKFLKGVLKIPAAFWFYPPCLALQKKYIWALVVE